MRRREKFQLSPTKPRKDKTRPAETEASKRLYEQSISTASLSLASFDGVSGAEEAIGSRSMPRMTFKSPMKKAIAADALKYIPVMEMEPPIVVRESATANQGDGECDSDEEQFNLTKEELRKTYKQLIARYKTAAEQFNRLEKKRVKMISQIDSLRQQVTDFEAEQAIVQAEFERLGLGEQN